MWLYNRRIIFLWFLLQFVEEKKGNDGAIDGSKPRELVIYFEMVPHHTQVQSAVSVHHCPNMNGKRKTLAGVSWRRYVRRVCSPVAEKKGETTVTAFFLLFVSIH